MESLAEFRIVDTAKEVGVSIVTGNTGVVQKVGADGMFRANEGKVLIIANGGQADNVVEILKRNDMGRMLQ